MSSFNLIKKKNLKKKILLFPLTYKRLLLYNSKKEKVKSPFKHNYKLLLRKENKDLNKINKKSENILPKIDNTKNKYLKHNISASPGINNIFDSYNDSKLSPCDSQRANNELEDINNRNKMPKLYISKQFSEIINDDNGNNNNNDNNNDSNFNKLKFIKNNGLNLKTDSNDIKEYNVKYNVKYNKNNINFFGTPSSIKKNNHLIYQYDPSKLRLLYDNNNNIFNRDFKLKNKEKKEHLSIKAVKGKSKEKKVNKEKKKNCPEELHFYYISIIQKGKKEANEFEKIKK